MIVKKFEGILKNRVEKLVVCYDHQETIVVEKTNKKLHSMCKPITYEFIETKTLGNWAFKKAYKSGGYDLDDDSFYVYREIAIACLGMEEVVTRLRDKP